MGTVGFLYIVLLTAAVQLVAPQYDVVYRGHWNISDPGYMELFDHWRGEDVVDGEDRAERYSVLLSTVMAGPAADRGYVYQLEHPGKYVEDMEAMTIREVTSEVLWPTDVQQVPYDVFDRDVICVPDGFALPAQADGGLHLGDVTDSWDDVELHTMTSDPEYEWIYSFPVWHDMDGDELRDVVGCRYRFGSNESLRLITSEFVWLRHPEQDAFQEPWDVHVMKYDVCDVRAAGVVTLTADGEDYDVIFTVGYYSDVLMVFWSTHPDGLWTDTDDIQQRVIAESPAPQSDHYFDLKVDDLNKDGSPDVLVTMKSSSSGRVLAYEIPEDFRVDVFPEHTVSEGFVPDMGFPGAGSPGICQVFYPSDQQVGLKPWVVLSGDDDGSAYYLSPQSQDLDDWQYDTVMFADEGPQSQVGSPAAADTNGDGFAEIFIPSYTYHVVRLYSFAEIV